MEELNLKSGFVFNNVVFVDYSLYEKNGSVMYFLTFMDKETLRQCKVLYFPQGNFSEQVFRMLGKVSVDVYFDVSNKGGFIVSEIVRCDDSVSILAS